MKQDLEKFNKPYDPKEVEEKIYKIWEESVFNPDNLSAANKAKKLTKLKAKSFCIIMPRLMPTVLYILATRFLSLCRIL